MRASFFLREFVRHVALARTRQRVRSAAACVRGNDERDFDVDANATRG